MGAECHTRNRERMPPGSITVPQKPIPLPPNRRHTLPQRMAPVNQGIIPRLLQPHIPPRHTKLRRRMPRTPRPGRILITTASSSPAAGESTQAIPLPPQPTRLTNSSLPRTHTAVPRQPLPTQPQVLPLQATTSPRMVANTRYRNSRRRSRSRRLVGVEEVIEPKTEDAGPISVPPPQEDFP